MSSIKVKKGLIFAGCSFTWGQGLYFYSKMSNLDYTNPNSYSISKVTNSHKRYKDVLRFPRLVANHFETFEIVKLINGGCDDHSISFIDELFEGKSDTRTFDNEISHIIFQTSELTRNQFNFNFKVSIIRNFWTLKMKYYING